MTPKTLDLVRKGNAKKGDVLGTARIAGIQAAKRTHELIPLCHPLPISQVEIELTPDATLPGILARALRLLDADGADLDRAALEVRAHTLISLSNVEFELAGLELATRRLDDARTLVSAHHLDGVRVEIANQESRFFLRTGRPHEAIAAIWTVVDELNGYLTEQEPWKVAKDESQTARLHTILATAAEGLRAAVLADMGLTIGSDWMFGPELASGAIVRVLQDWSLPPIDLWAVFPGGRMASAKARAFASFVEAALDGVYSAAA